MRTEMHRLAEYPHIVSLDYLQKEDIAAHARATYDMGRTIDQCPFDEGSEQASKWREHYIACQLDKEGEPE